MKKQTKIFNITRFRKSWMLLAMLPALSCSKLIEIDPPINSVGTEKVFQNDAKAFAALAGLYSTMINTDVLNTLCYGGLSLTGGLLADEVSPFMGSVDVIFNPYRINTVRSDNESLFQIWKDGYRYIYIANTLIEGVAASAYPTLSDSARRQITGEAKFIRAWSHFQLTNLFGPIPVVLTQDVNQTMGMSRSTQEQVYQQLEVDLKEAYQLLQPDFRVSGGARVRPSRDAVAGLLARVYLYQGRWAEAEAAASTVIGNSAFMLEPLNKTFRDNNREAIWQLKREYEGLSDKLQMEALNFMPQFRWSVLPPDAQFIWKDKSTYESVSLEPGYVIPGYTVNDELISAFEPGDNRMLEWIDSIPQPDEAPYYGKLRYYVRKYENEFGFDQKADMHLNMQRLAEVYLIRAEARAQQGINLTGAAEDIDAVRRRAGLLPTTARSKSDLLDAVMQERRVELFCEWGHRWFDLKRTGKAAAMAAAHPEKLPWSDNKLLLPVPIKELELNPSLGQNPGY